MRNMTTPSSLSATWRPTGTTVDTLRPTLHLGDTQLRRIDLLNAMLISSANDAASVIAWDVGGSVLLVSQFTLAGDARHGNRPSFSGAARPEEAEPLCAQVKADLEAAGLRVETGRFRTHMEVSLVNDGPVTILLDSRKDF